MVQRAMQAGAIGYVLKDISPQELADAIRAAHTGHPTLAPEAVQALVRAADPSPKLGDDLSVREREVLALVVEGLSNAQIGERLVISTATAKYHVGGILAKLGASTRSEAMAIAWQHNLVARPGKF
jgi:NarL family two-component system response regulator LiaR